MEFPKVTRFVKWVRWASSSSSSRWLNRANNDFYSRKARHLNLKSRAAFKLQAIDAKFKIFTKATPQNIVDLGFAPGAWTQTALSLTHPDSQVLGVDILPCKPPKGASAIQANIMSRHAQQQIVDFFRARDDDVWKLSGNSVKDENLANNEIIGGDPSVISGLSNIKEPTNNSQPTSSTTSISVTSDSHTVDVVLSDMYEPLPQITGFWNNTTNRAYYRMANTSGLKAKDHYASMDLCEAGLILCLQLLRENGIYVCKYMRGKEDEILYNKLLKCFKKVYKFKPPASRQESCESYFVCLGWKGDAQISRISRFS